MWRERPAGPLVWEPLLPALPAACWPCCTLSVRILAGPFCFAPLSSSCSAGWSLFRVWRWGGRLLRLGEPLGVFCLLAGGPPLLSSSTMGFILFSLSCSRGSRLLLRRCWSGCPPSG